MPGRLVLLGIAAWMTACGSDGTIVSPSPPENMETGVLIGAGDIAVCASPTTAATARLLNTQPGTVFAAGDLAYPSGRTEDFQSCYDPTWGRHKERTRPAPGNHEYESPDAAPYFAYFGASAGSPGLGYYRYQSGSWDVFSLNSNLGGARETAQVDWLKRELFLHTPACTIAYWHHPRFSSGPHGFLGPELPARELWNALDAAGADVVIGGHDHLYERFAPQNPDGRSDADYGMRQFVVGTGGAELVAPIQRLPNSELLLMTFGVLRLTLEPNSYRWDFLSANDGNVLDSGSGRCHPRRP